MPRFSSRHRIPVVGKVGVLDLDGAGSIRMGQTDRCAIAKELFWNRGKLSSPADKLALKAAITFAEKAKVFLDVGAYSGLFALAAGRVNPEVKSYAYEILPENFLTLYRNVFLNRLTLVVEPRLCGISSGAGTITVPAELHGGTFPSSVALDWRFEEGVQVPLRTLDELHAAIDGPVVMKIDVECFETEVLEGAVKLIERTHPDIVCEVLRRATRVADLEALLRTFDYRIYHITNDGLVERTSISPKKAERDWLFSVRSASELRRLGLDMAS